jgi:hypothetical protein
LLLELVLNQKRDGEHKGESKREKKGRKGRERKEQEKKGEKGNLKNRKSCSKKALTSTFISSRMNDLQVSLKDSCFSVADIVTTSWQLLLWQIEMKTHKVTM